MAADHAVVDAMHTGDERGDRSLRIYEGIDQRTSEVIDDGDFDDGVAVGGAEPGRFGVEVDDHGGRITTFGGF